ncbi:MAG TPA: DUF6134 family protein [Alphaproteobacteria bacterium]|nr:DUF6134 family protein [Alphaproteobacteria bacterium]
MRLRAILALCLLLCAAAPAAQAAQQTGTLDFTVLRDGDAIGNNKISFQTTSDEFDVTVDTNIVVKIAMIPVYRFEHHGQERWQNGRLFSLSSRTNDDGKHHFLSVHPDAGQLRIDGDGRQALIDSASIPASLWNAALVRQTQLLNTLDGSAMAVKIDDLGQETVSVHGIPVSARHYSVSGDLKREVWYDGDDRLVRVQFKADDDTKIEYVLK